MKNKTTNTLHRLVFLACLLSPGAFAQDDFDGNVGTSAGKELIHSAEFEGLFDDVTKDSTDGATDSFAKASGAWAGASLPSLGLIVKYCPKTPGRESSFKVTAPSFVVLGRTQAKTQDLCTLVIETDNGNEIPVSRSFQGTQWERSGGFFSAQSVSNWKCNPTHCINSLPVGYKYKLQRRTTVAYSSKERIVSFLEQASFGVIPSQLAGWKGSFRDYIVAQEKLPPTFHREMFRRRSNPHWLYDQPEFAAHLNPCGAKSTFRKYILTPKDRNKVMKVKKVGDRWEISIDGHVRSMVKQLRYLDSRWKVVDGGSYKVCTSLRLFRRGIFNSVFKGRCRRMIAEDLVVDFPADYVPAAALASPVPNLANTNYWKKTSDFLDEFVLLKAIGGARCKDLPSREFGSAPVFVKTHNGEWLQHDPRIMMLENTLENPTSNGGIDLWSTNRTRSCGNAPRTFVNEKSCHLSKALTCTNLQSKSSQASTNAVVCGSPGEVANDPTVGDSWLDINSIANSRSRSLGLPIDTSGARFARQREYVWSEIALNSEDQLRQRVAWALSQIFALPKAAIGSEARNTEFFLNYYDIFVRHALGNYRDVLKETTYSPLMGESLSFVNSRSVGYTFGKTGLQQFPDENFAREIMQLFTIGLERTRFDGTQIINKSNNKTIPTYDNDDIVSFSKIWTGFARQRGRANNEKSDGNNKLDPMRTVAAFRDQFPKMDLYNGYIGDQYPLCVDLPERAYLRPGAKFRLLGAQPAPEQVADTNSWKNSLTVNRVEVAASGGSGLYKHLCKPDSDGECSYPGYVELETILNCGASKKGECADVDTLRTVKVKDMFYEYLTVPCVEQPFFEGGIKIANGASTSLGFCADPRLPMASEACCTNTQPVGDARPMCLYAGERVKFSTAESRCAAGNKQLCNYGRFRGTAVCPSSGRQWTNSKCSVQVKVNSEGQVSIVHKTDAASVEDLVKKEDPSYFRVNWARRQFPTPKGGCGKSCSVFQDTCICNIKVTNKARFSTPPTKSADLLRYLKVGHADPDIYDAGTFVSKKQGDYSYHSADGTCCDENTVFEVKDWFTQRTHFLRNLESTVSIDGTSYYFRNPPNFNKIAPTLLSETVAEHEVEALIDHLFYHRNTAPFVAKRMLQRFGLSNPSPHLVQRVAQVFRKGKYINGGVEIGTGKYGDLYATAAIILLDRDSRSPSIDYDPFRGSVREPLLKVISFLRALDFKSSIPLAELDLMDEKVGQMAYEQPSVFSYFSPDFSPPGAVADATMVAPESEVMTSTNVVGTMNGFLSLIDNGLVSCKQGFGYGECSNGNAGGLQFQPSDPTNIPATVDEVSMLLTGSRMDKTKKDFIADTISDCRKSKTVSINWMISTYDRTEVVVGDTVVFEYADRFHNVARHQEATCDFGGSTMVSEVSPYSYTFQDSDVGEVTFACQKTGHCDAGQIVTFEVKPRESCGVDDPKAVWSTAAKLIVTTPEFNTMDSVDEFAKPEKVVDGEATPGKGTYKAVIHLAFRGGADSYNILAPKDSCGTLRQEYESVRGSIAMDDDELLNLKGGMTGQPCSSFGVHKALPFVEQMYNDGDLLFLANTGILTEPVTKTNYKAKTLTRLFAHNTHQEEVDTLDPRNTAVGTGTLGRMADSLQADGYRTARTAVEVGPLNLAGESGKPEPIYSLDRNGIDLLSNLTDFSSSATREVIEYLNGRGPGSEQSGKFGELWSSTLSRSMNQTESIYYLLQKNTETQNEFSDAILGKRFKLISQLVQTREERKVDRDFFFVTYGSFDHHSNLKTNLNNKLSDVNEALETLVKELKDIGVWDDVVIVQSSDFARTLTPNSSSGSDHGWGGNHIVAGGSVKGKNIMGQYPSKLDASGSLNVGRGRIIPTTPWDSPFNAVAEYLNVPAKDLDQVLPNRDAFPSLFTAADMFV